MGAIFATHRRRSDGRYRYHQTSRPDGTYTYWTSRGDDPSLPYLVGGGEEARIHHKTSGQGQVDPVVGSKYIDFNMVENESYIHEAYMQWRNCDHDVVSVGIVPRIVSYVALGVSDTTFSGTGSDNCTVSGTYTGDSGKYMVVEVDSDSTFRWSSDDGTSWEEENVTISGTYQYMGYGLYVDLVEMSSRVVGDRWEFTAAPYTSSYNKYCSIPGLPEYIVIPSVIGLGTPIWIMSDLTDPQQGLVYTPINDEGIRPQSFWNTTYDTVTKKFSTPTPSFNEYGLGTGQYNIFCYEVKLHKFLNKLSLLENGFMEFRSSDTQQIGHGTRILLEWETDTESGDHDWDVVVIACMHRKITCNPL